MAHNSIPKATLGRIPLYIQYLKEISDAKIDTDLVSPKLLPNYTNQKGI